MKTLKDKTSNQNLFKKIVADKKAINECITIDTTSMCDKWMVGILE